MICRMKFLLFVFLPYFIQAAFVSPPVAGTTFWQRTTTTLPPHLNPISRENQEAEPETPGIPQGTDSWPTPVTEPKVTTDTTTDTPGIPRGADSWPSAVQAPVVNPGPCDCPGLPTDDSGIPSFIEEPRVP